MNERVAAKVARFPEGPGVYMFSDGRGRILYVGKAANLRARVRSYLKPGGDGRLAVRFLEEQAADVEFLATRTEQEALLLENTIIKKRKPLYNVRLKDDKAFLLLRLDRREPWPWFRLVRRRRDDGADYFGPYASAKSVRATLRLLHKIVPLRDCTDGVFRNRSRPCIKHQIGRCPAPCVLPVDREDYDRALDAAAQILRGDVGPVLRRLRAEMDTAAERLEFERAQALKSQIEALTRVAERQTVVGTDADRDVLGLHRAGEEVTAVFLVFRGGLLESSRRYRFRSRLPDDLLLGELLGRFYDGDPYVPGEVLTPGPVAEQEVVEAWLSSKRGARVRILQPRKGRKRRQLEMALDNARLSDAAAADEEARRQGALARVAELAGLEEAPRRVHCLDVSTIQGTSTVASRVCFVDGAPHKAGYRRLRISAAAAGDDFSAMDEAVRRSTTRCLTTEGDELPDLLVVDGGRAQLGVARRALQDLGLEEEVPVVALAKSRVRGVGDARRPGAERLFVSGRPRPIELAADDPGALLLAAVRDEAHRFAVRYHRALRGRLGSGLEGIEGVGAARRRALLRYFGSLARVRAASLEELRRVPGLPDRVAERVHRALRGDSASRRSST